MWLLSVTNAPLYRKIVKFLYQYYYISINQKMQFDHEICSDIDLMILNKIEYENIETLIKQAPIYILLKEFMNYDLYDHAIMLDELPEDIEDMIRKFKL